MRRGQLISFSPHAGIGHFGYRASARGVCLWPSGRSGLMSALPLGHLGTLHWPQCTSASTSGSTSMQCWVGLLHGSHGVQSPLGHSPSRHNLRCRHAQCRHPVDDTDGDQRLLLFGFAMLGHTSLKGSGRVRQVRSAFSRLGNCPASRYWRAVFSSMPALAAATASVYSVCSSISSLERR